MRLGDVVKGLALGAGIGLALGGIAIGLADLSVWIDRRKVEKEIEKKGYKGPQADLYRACHIIYNHN